jgi:hypothetical protein
MGEEHKHDDVANHHGQQPAYVLILQRLPHNPLVSLVLFTICPDIPANGTAFSQL